VNSHPSHCGIFKPAVTKPAEDRGTVSPDAVSQRQVGATEGPSRWAEPAGRGFTGGWHNQQREGWITPRDQSSQTSPSYKPSAVLSAQLPETADTLWPERRHGPARAGSTQQRSSSNVGRVAPEPAALSGNNAVRWETHFDRRTLGDTPQSSSGSNIQGNSTQLNLFKKT